MEISKKSFLLSIALTAIVCSVLAYEVAPKLVYHPQVARVRDNVFIVYELVDGRVSYSVHNVITNIGENKTLDRHSTNQTATDYALNWISIGNVSGTLQTKTQLDSEYARAKGSIVEWYNSQDAAMNVTNKFEFTETKTLDGAGLHWNGTGGSNNNLYAVANFAGGSQTFNNGENLTVRWVVTFNAN